MDPALLLDQFAAQAARTPHAVAVIDGGTEWDYATLDRRADQVANLLGAVEQGTLVVVCLPRSPDLVAALLGVWKAGAAYVPFDPGHPPERLQRIFADSGADLALTDRASAASIGGLGVRVLLAEDIAASPDTPVLAEPTSDDLAYAIYTSGSTGQPKAVLIGHGAIANRVAWTVGEHRLGPADRVLQKTTVSFDAAAWEIFAPLVSGGAVVLAPAGAAGDPQALLRAVAEYDVSILQVVPSLLRLLVNESGWHECRSLRLLFSAGEPLDSELCELVRKRHPVEIWNTYGPTECAIDVTAHPVDPEQSSGRVPIGRPIAGCRVMVLDQVGEPTPIGVAGELYAGGAGLARGYLGRPALTAERFVPDPYGPPGARLYRTGDQVRWRSDGTLDYLGRLDDQLKVNGVRIEPGEVESALASHPGVRGVVVAARPGPDGTARLAAYLVTRDGRLSPGVLREFLRGVLPAMLIPSVFIPVEAFPLTANGKVDRAALASLPDLPEPRRADEPVITSMEATVAQVWEDLLGIADVTPGSDFFQRGGSSLLLARLATRLGALVGREVAVHDLFSATTVAAQASLVEAAAEPVATVPRAPRDRPIPLSSEQQPLWFLDRLNPGNPEWVTPLLIRLPGDLAGETVGQALEALAARHEILRTRYSAVAGEPVQVIDAEARIPLRIAGAPADRAELSRLVAGEFEQGFDLERGPVCRALLVRGSASEQVLVLAVHHIASDGRSSVVLADDLRELCTALAEGRKPQLPPLPVQYADYAIWQRNRMTEEYLEPHLRFWQGELAGLNRFELPADHVRPAVRNPSGAALSFTVPRTHADGIVELSRQRGTTPFAAYLTVFCTLLARWSGAWDLAVGAPVAGRTRPELADVAGPFHNTLVLRCGLDPALAFGDAVDLVWDRNRRALAHRDLPFEQVVAALAPARDLSRTPLYQVMYNFLDEGVTVTGAADHDALQAAWRVAKTDLTLFVYAAADGGVTGVLEYATSLFDESTITRMSQQFLVLLEAALADPSAGLGALGAQADAPRGPVERLLAEHWSELLGHEVGVVQNFFQIGGTSRLALMLMARLQEDLDLELPVRTIFERPTVARLAEAVRALAEAEQETTPTKETRG